MYLTFHWIVDSLPRMSSNVSWVTLTCKSRVSLKVVFQKKCFLFVKVIHRDLAARNVLVGEEETCKVTDFGMARDVQEDNIYERKTRVLIFLRQHMMSWKPCLVWLKMPHWSDWLKKTSSVNLVPFSGTYVTELLPLGAFVLFKDYANSLHFCFLFKGVSL